MDADEVVVHHVQAHRVAVILEFLAETVREPSEPPHPHPMGQVRPLDEAGVMCALSGVPAMNAVSIPVMRPGE